MCRKVRCFEYGKMFNGLSAKNSIVLPLRVFSYVSWLCGMVCHTKAGVSNHFWQGPTTGIVDLWATILNS